MTRLMRSSAPKICYNCPLNTEKVNLTMPWLYLCVMVDLYSRMVIGLSMDDNMTSDLVCNSLQMAMFRRGMPSDVIVHSDKGSQYCSENFQEKLTEHKLVSSMS